MRDVPVVTKCELRLRGLAFWRCVRIGGVDLGPFSLRL